MRLRLPERPPVNYQVPRDNFKWGEHILRLQLTGALISWFSPDTVLDPACGDGTVVAAAHRFRPIAGARMCDISRPNFYHVGTVMRDFLPENLECGCQPIETTLREPRQYDLVILTEILEHIDDPVGVLRLARERANYLVASSPLFNDAASLDENPEHVWQFDAMGYGEMLEEAGWSPLTFIPISFPIVDYGYTFQLWGAQ